MLEIKRKPNSPGGRATSTPKSCALTEARAASMDGHYPIDHPAIHGVAAMPTPSVASRKRPPLIAPPRSDVKDHQTKLPVITGEAQCKGSLNLDGMASGQLGGSGGSLSVRQRARSFFCEPEFSGEVSFRDMVRVNGYIAGTVYSKKGTLIVDIGARVDAHVDVAVAIIGGAVNGDIVAHERVQIGPNAKVYGNIWTRSIEIKNGAIFEGICSMIPEEQIAG
ncbi:MAG: polymer-forming cytoskeletal protein [Pyrinomonadaceae bacterium]|nr:polymer-forming cytoskeletal protein [Pyrinomonadaceae bacterium]MBA3569954.1 polymer-forming cytoskeletal protein [Pyrinomonadaceae bacterium]MDQ3174833.1 polymer-forming cytoskeletal protein [Acidobacteriota bacterium]